jgi:two-component system, NarL family, nitrate/nitrite response regulator NarL
MEVEEMAKVLLIEDHALLAESLSSVLCLAGFDVHTLLAPSPRDIEQALEWDPVIALLDLDLGPSGDGTRFIGTLTRSSCHVVVLSALKDPLALCRCYEAGAKAVLEKVRSIDTLVSVLKSVLAGGDPTAAARQELFANRRRFLTNSRERLASFELLTAREGEVLAALMEGQVATEIATSSGVSIWTVRAQIKSTLQKLNVNTQIAAVAKARRCGWEPSAALT